MTASSDSRPTEGNGAPPSDFEASLAELEQIVQQLEGGALGLEASLARFEHGIHLLRRCYETLDKAEQRIELLTGFDADGNPVTTQVELSIAVEQTEVEVTRERQPAPRQRSVEQRRAEAPQEDPHDAGPTLF